LENLAAAIGGALELGCDAQAIAGAIAGLNLPSGRYESIALPNGVRVVFDAYNASMTGMIATLDAFKEEPGARRIAVLGSMAELGDEAPQMHAAVGKHAAQCGLDGLLVGGEFAQQLASGARDGGMDAGRIVQFDSNGEAVSWLMSHAQSGDAVLLKGSRMYKLEEVLEGLRR
jgi:UDP-N-acetylmuramoyl-tripeptide--D-alanyl-D-alanine ligase